VNFASDATETQIAAVQMDDRENFLAYKQDGNILVNELKGALLAMNMAKDFVNEKRWQAALQKKEEHWGARLYIDNKAVIALVNRGRVKWTDKTISIFQLFNFLKQIEAFKEDFAFIATYISTKSNPADALSRRALGPVAQSPVPDSSGWSIVET
jgi:hypothetical protein